MKKYTLYIIALLFCGNFAQACDCAYKPSVDSAARNSTYIFSGKLVSKVNITVLMEDTVWTILDSPVTNEPLAMDYVKYTFTVDIRYKGIGRKKKTIDVYTPEGTASCGYQFQKGYTYIVYGDDIELLLANGKKKLGVRTTTCDRTDKFKKEEGKTLQKLCSRK